MKKGQFILVFLLCANILIYMMCAMIGIDESKLGGLIWGIFTVASLFFLIGWAIWDGMKGYNND